MAIIQHASVSSASNQYNGLSDKEGGVVSHSVNGEGPHCNLLHEQHVHKILMPALTMNTLGQVSAYMHDVHKVRRQFIYERFQLARCLGKKPGR